MSVGLNGPSAPLLPPPGPSGPPLTDQVKGKEGKATEKASGAVAREGVSVREGKGHEQSHGDGTQLSTDLQEVHHEEQAEQSDEHEGGQQGQGDQSGGQGSGTGSQGGQSDQGSHDSDTAASLQDWLGQLDQTSTTTKAAAKVSTQFATKDVIMQASSERVDNTLNANYTSNDWSKFTSDFPNLVPNKDIDTGSVAKETAGNPWLNTSFMTTITANLMAVARMKGEQQGIEGMMGAKLMNVLWDLGVSLGALAMQKAELEAQMHMWEAVAGFIGLAVSVGIAAMGVAGIAATKMAESKMSTASEMENPKDSNIVGTGGKPKGGVEEGSFYSSSSKTKTNTAPKLDDAPEPSVGKGAEKPVMGKERVAQQHARETGLGSHRTGKNVDQEKGADPTDTEFDEGLTTSQEKEFSSGKPVSDTEAESGQQAKSSLTRSGSTEQESAGEAAPRSKTTEDGSFIVDGEVSIQKSGQGKTGWKSTKWKSGKIDRREGGSNLGDQAKVDTKTQTDKAASWATKGEMLSNLSMSLGQVGGQIGSIADNLVQMVFKPLIGEVEQEMEIQRAAQTITKQMLDSITSDFRDCGQAVDQALQALQKIQDETSRAHNYSARG